MDLVSNFAGEISSSQFSNKTQGANPNLDPNDNTFENLLEKQLNNKVEDNFLNSTNNSGMISGISIGDFDRKIQSAGMNTEINALNAVKNLDQAELEKFNSGKDFSTSEVLTFFPSLFNSKPTLTQTNLSGLFEFERKMAANSYGKYSRSIITDLNEFVVDTLKLS